MMTGVEDICEMTMGQALSERLVALLAGRPSLATVADAVRHVCEVDHVALVELGSDECTVLAAAGPELLTVATAFARGGVHPTRRGLRGPGLVLAGREPGSGFIGELVELASPDVLAIRLYTDPEGGFDAVDFDTEHADISSAHLEHGIMQR